MKRRTVLVTPSAVAALIFAAISLTFAVAGVLVGPWWSAAAWAVGAVVWLLMAWEEATDRHLLVSRTCETRLMLELSEQAVLTLRVQGEERPEVMDQTGWLAASITATQAELRAAADRTGRCARREVGALLDRLWVDIAPCIEQVAADHPTRRTRAMARRARKRALRASRRAAR